MSKHEPSSPQASTTGGTDLSGMLSRRGGRSTTTTVILCLVLVAVGLLGGVFIGHHFGQPAAAATGGNARFGQGGFPGFGNGSGAPPSFPAGGQLQFGTITSINGNTITLKSRTGATLKVNVGSGTTIQVTKSGSIGDLGTGDTIVVVGSKSSDGSIAAQRISEGGGFGGRFGGGFGGGASPAP